MNDLHPHQKALIDFLIKKDFDYDEVEEQVNLFGKQIGKTAILESNYLYLCRRKKKIKQIQKNLIK